MLWRNPICGGFPDYWGVFREFDFVSLTGQATVTGGGDAMSDSVQKRFEKIVHGFVAFWWTTPVFCFVCYSLFLALVDVCWWMTGFWDTYDLVQLVTPVVV